MNAGHQFMVLSIYRTFISRDKWNHDNSHELRVAPPIPRATSLISANQSGWLIRASLIGHCLVGRESQFRSCFKLMSKGQMKQVKSCGFNGHDFMILKVKTDSECQFEK